MQVPYTEDERKAAQEYIFAHPIWNSPNYLYLAIELKMELTRAEASLRNERRRARLEAATAWFDKLDAFLEVTQ